jgi:hypothetical protein
MEDDAQTLNSSLNGTASGLTTQARIGAPNAYDGNLQNLVDGEATSDLNTGLTTLRTAIDGSSGAVVSGTGGADFEFAGYSGTTSQVFADENITVSSNTVTVKIGGEDYTYSASSSAINNGDTVSFTGSSGKLLLLTYAGGGVNNGNANANANDLQGALTSFFQVGSIITPGNLSSKVAVLEEGIDGATSGNAMAGLTNLKTAIDGSSSFSIAGTTGSDLTVPAYDGATSQVFGADAFSNGGTTTISVTIGTDTYTYDNTGVTNISGYGTIRFTNGSKSLIIQNNTGTPITAGTDQLIADAIVSALNTYFGGGSKLRAGNLRVKIGVPTVNGTPSNLAAVIGGSGIDMASLLGDPITADSGVSALIKASTASNDHGVFSDLSGFQNATDIKNQLSTFLALFSNLAGGATSVTFDFSGGAPTSLANLITAATSVT